MTEETKIIYYKDSDQDKVPYMIKLSIAPDKATLKDFKQALNVNVRQFKFFFQQIVEDFGTVKEEICDDNMKLPFVNGRAICWLHQVEGSLISSDSRSQTSLNLQEFNTKQQPPESNNANSGEMLTNNYQFTSMQSVSSQGSSKSNNENLDKNSGVVSRNRNKPESNGQIYDTLNNRKSNKVRQSAPLKDLNADDTSTDTESLINGFDDFRIQHQRPSSMMIGGLGNGGSGSMRRSKQAAPFNTNPVSKGHHTNQKRSLDSQYIMTNQLRMTSSGQQQQQVVIMQNRHSTNGNFYSNYNQQQQQQQQYNSYKSHGGCAKQPRNNEFDSYSENSDDEATNIEFDETCDDSQNSSQARTATTAPSIISSNLDTTTFFDTENDDDDDGQFSSITENTNSTMASSRYHGANRNRRKFRHKLPSQHHHLKPNNSLHSSMSSLTDSTMSLNIITVTLKMDSINFLGISIVGQSNKGGEGGIYVGSIMSGGAVAQDGRIEPGDMILQVNDVSFENMSNDDAVRVLREAVMKPGPVKLVVAKCWDPNPQGYFTVSKQEPIRPIDPSAWVAHTQAHTGTYPNNAGNYHQTKQTNYRLSNSVSTFGSNSSLSSSLADSTISNAFNPNYYHHQNAGLTATTTTHGDSTRFGNEHLNLTIKTDMETLVRAMAASDSGLDVRDRNWLKITIPNAFIGSDVVDWLFNHVEGFPDRRDARKYACDMLRFGFIRHAVNKVRFSEQCYYIFGDFAAANGTLMTLNGNNGGVGMGGGNLFTLNEESEVDFDSVSELDRDTLYAPMNYQANYQMQAVHHVQASSNYGQVPKLYSHLNGIGGPPPPPSYMSSSSSNATSNSTSTTSNNTTTQTIATTTSASHMNSNTNNNNNNNYTNSSSGVGGSNILSNSSNGSAITTNSTFSQLGHQHQVISNANTACQFYYPAPSQQLNTFNHQDLSQLSQGSAQSHQFFNHKNMNSLNTDTDVDDTLPNQPASLITTPISIHSNHRFNRLDTKSMRSSDGGSSGNGSDVELLSSKKSKNRSSQQQQSNYYEIGLASTASSKSESRSRLKQQRGLEQVPKELRSSKQSFTQAMEKPCEFFVDVM